MRAAAKGLAVVGDERVGQEVPALIENKIEPFLLTAAQLAERLQLTRQRIYALVRNGSLPACRVGGEWRFDWTEVLAAVKKP